jgi:deoxyribodipyrimidine photo-lyase
MYEKSIYIFHRSLRLIDNIALINASKKSKIVIPIFIFTPEQISQKNTFKSDNAINFMLESLSEIQNKIKIYFFYGENTKVINKIIKNNIDIDAIFFNQDYTKYAVERENNIIDICNKHDIDINIYNDYLLHEINQIKTGNGNPYSKFTPYYNKIINHTVNKPNKHKINNFGTLSSIDKSISISLEQIRKKFVNNKNVNTLLKGGRKFGLLFLKNIKLFAEYNDSRNEMTINTTQLSSHIKFGTISIREIYHKIKNTFNKNHPLIRQLYWREFYFNIAYNNPDIFIGKSFKSKYDNIKWKKSVSKLNKWKKGETGFPIVDASMKELNQTGYMHNRGRLITANFLVKLLNIDWREGEKYFAQKLTDYDPSVNNGNWQWIAGSGADSQQYNRIYNPCSQSEKHDKNAEYIKKWLPQLSDIEPKYIHNWARCFSFFKKINYSKPIIDYKKSRHNTLNMYKKYLY